MSGVLDTILKGLEQSLLMAYEVWWALVLGFAISAIVQAWVPHERIESALSGSGQFALAKYIGGIVMIVLMAGLLRLFVSRRLEEQAREQAQRADTGHQHHSAAEELGWRERLTSLSAWSDVAHNFRGDWQMLYEEITAGFFLAGFIGLPNELRALRARIRGRPGALQHSEPGSERGMGGDPLPLTSRLEPLPRSLVPAARFRLPVIGIGCVHGER